MESCTVAVLGESGKRPCHERFQMSAALLKRFITEVPKPRYLCMEEGKVTIARRRAAAVLAM